MAVYAAAGTLPDAERLVWVLDQQINARGVWIDTDFVIAAKAIADMSIGEVLEEFDQLTGGDGLTPHQIEKTRGWLAERGLALTNLQADTVEEALESIELPDDLRRALEIRQIVAATSLKKLDAMLACVGPDGRARGLLQYHGARTGRWSGQLIQPQNFPRPILEKMPDPEDLVTAVRPAPSMRCANGESRSTYSSVDSGTQLPLRRETCSAPAISLRSNVACFSHSPGSTINAR